MELDNDVGFRCGVLWAISKLSNSKGCEYREEFEMCIDGKAIMDDSTEYDVVIVLLL